MKEIDWRTLTQILQEVRDVIVNDWKPVRCDQCGREAPMVRMMHTEDRSSEEDGVTSRIVIQYKPASADWVMRYGDGPRGVHCPPCNKLAREIRDEERKGRADGTEPR